MADHFSGPRALADPGSDITDVYAFASPQRPGHMLLVLDVFPATPATAEETLRQTLAQAMNDPHIQQAITQIGTLHEARFVLLDGGKRLMFASSFDGPWDTYIDDFARTDIGRAFDDTWQHARGYPGVKSPGHQGVVQGAHGGGRQLPRRLSQAGGEGNLEGAGRERGVPAGAGRPCRRGGAAAPSTQAAAGQGR